MNMKKLFVLGLSLPAVSHLFWLKIGRRARAEALRSRRPVAEALHPLKPHGDEAARLKKSSTGAIRGYHLDVDFHVLVILMTFGSGLFYGGLVRQEHAVGADTGVCRVLHDFHLWVIYGYSWRSPMRQHEQLHRLSKMFLAGWIPASRWKLLQGRGIHEMVFMVFQRLCGITTLIVAASGGIKFSALMVFSALGYLLLPAMATCVFWRRRFRRAAASCCQGALDFAAHVCTSTRHGALVGALGSASASATAGSDGAHNLTSPCRRLFAVVGWFVQRRSNWKPTVRVWRC